MLLHLAPLVSQDLSVAGLRKGLRHEANGDEETTRSGLFMEAVRIIKEMREATNGEYPRFALWENVPGAFSSNKGEDFRIVLEELIKIVEPTAAMPAVPPFGWPYADSYSGDGWSLAYRVFDAQHWGVPQRRRRIHLVADFRGQCAREVLFEREGLRGYFTPGRTPWESLAAYAERGAGADHSEGAGEASAALSFGVTTKGNGDAFIAEERHTSLTSGGGQAGQGYPCAMVPYTLKIRSGCEGGGKGALVQTDRSATLATNNDQYLFQPVGFDGYNSALTGEVSATLGINCGTSTGRNGAVYALDHDVVDGNILDDQGGQQISVRDDGKVPTLRAEMHGNIPCVMEAAGFKELNSANARSVGYGHEVAPTLSAEKYDASVCVKSWDARGNGDGDTVSTITGDHENRITDYSSVVVAPVGINGDTAGTLDANYFKGCGLRQGVEREVVAIPIHDQATRFSGKRGEKSDGKGNGLGVGEAGDPMNTLTSGDRHAVCFADTYQEKTGPLMANSHPGSYSGQDAYTDMFVVGKEEQPIALDCAYQKTVGSLCARDYKGVGSQYVSEDKLVITPHVRYIVRRLTPTECARLQGFADSWGHIDEKDDFTEEEYRFWLDVRNTHAEINGKAVKDYTKKQMLAWYNKLHTDSAEYKMWGNGIALPPALYCMQGIAEVLEREAR